MSAREIRALKAVSLNEHSGPGLRSKPAANAEEEEAGDAEVVVDVKGRGANKCSGPTSRQDSFPKRASERNKENHKPDYRWVVSLGAWPRGLPAVNETPECVCVCLSRCCAVCE